MNVDASCKELPPRLKTRITMKSAHNRRYWMSTTIEFSLNHALHWITRGPQGDKEALRRYPPNVNGMPGTTTGIRRIRTASRGICDHHYTELTGDQAERGRFRQCFRLGTRVRKCECAAKPCFLRVTTSRWY
jgi:hypothetical protein